jgi:hypothetical protein
LKTLPSLDASPLQTLWDKPEDAAYLLPLPEPKDGDFQKVSGCKVFASDLGYRLRANGKGTIGLALKKLDSPLTGTVTFRTRFCPVAEADGLLRNGYLAFGGGPQEAELVKCGIRFRNQAAAIIQGALAGEKTVSKSAQVDAPDDQGLEAVVTVDLDARKITYTANGVKIETPLQTPLSAITHLGYVLDSGLIDAAPIEIQRP